MKIQLFPLFIIQENELFQPENGNTLLEEGKQTAIKDFAKLWKDKTFSDLTIIVEKKNIKVHKAILSCRSDFFYKKIQTELEKDNEFGEILRINDIKYNSIVKILEYIYTCDIIGLTVGVEQPNQSPSKRSLSHSKYKEYNVPQNSDSQLLEILQLSSRYGFEHLTKFIQNCLFLR